MMAATKLHLLGICGTFMAGIAALAKQLGFDVSGTDENVYPPMSDVLANMGVTLYQGYDKAHLDDKPDLVIIGNAMKRGNPMVEYVLEEKIPYQSAPQWLYENVLSKKTVLAIAGTHGKTTTASMLAWILETAGLNPGFLIGGIPENFGVSARLTESDYFVIEADEYDSAFFDKRSKFMQYHPDVLVINNLEFDHADIFSDLGAIQKQFHYLVRMMRPSATIIYSNETSVKQVIEFGAWSTLQNRDAGEWQWQAEQPDGSVFTLSDGNSSQAISWDLIGEHNNLNAYSASQAASTIGVSLTDTKQALESFVSPKRRLQKLATVNDITVYDDFAHHPSAIALTLAGMRAHVGEARVIAIVECRSYTMRNGIHKDKLADALKDADLVFIKEPEFGWNLSEVFGADLNQRVFTAAKTDDLIAQVIAAAKPSDHIVIMSNGGFDDIYQKLPKSLS